jgi:WD40 repeat protein
MERNRAGKNNWVGVIIIVAILIGAFFFVSRRQSMVAPETNTPASAAGINELPLFKNGLSAININADQIGFHSFSPDGKYFFFTTFAQTANPPNSSHLTKLSDGTTIGLFGTPERGLEDNRVIQLVSTMDTEPGMTLYFIATGQSKTFDLGTSARYGTLSPDGKTYIVNTQEGIKKIDIDTGLVTSFTKAQYDGAYAWYPDSNRVLGFKESGENLFEAGKGRTLGVWDMTTGDFTPLTTSITTKNIRMVQWVVPGVVARVNTGWDDGSHDYLVNVDMAQTIDIGDTSGSMMGGVDADATRGFFVVVGGDDQSTIGSTVLMYRGIEEVHRLTLPKGYFRQSVQIAGIDRVIYLRTKHGDRGVTEQALVSLDLTSGTETVLKELPARAYVSLSLSPDHKTWVLSQDDVFITGTL